MNRFTKQAIIKYFDEIGGNVRYIGNHWFFGEYQFPHSSESGVALKVKDGEVTFRGGTTSEYFRSFKQIDFFTKEINLRTFTKYKLERFGGELNNARPEGGNDFRKYGRMLSGDGAK